MTARSSDTLDNGIAKAGEADAAIAPPGRTPVTATFGTLRYHGVLQSDVDAGSRTKLATRAWATQAKLQSS